MNMKVIKASLIDIDGTLLDTEVFQYLTWRDVLRQTAGYDLSEKEYIKSYCGNSTKRIAERIQIQFDITLTPEEIFDMRERIVLEKVIRGEIKQMPYAAEVLEHFARKLPIALVTGASFRETEHKLTKSHLDAIVISYDIPIISGDIVTRGKPHPDSYIVAAKTLNVEPTDCIAFEDTLAGIESAESAGVTCLAVPNRWTRNKMPERKLYANLKEAQQAVEKNYLLQPNR
ncbi:unnamed protein product [marine sediment metagenome]|uniref:FCP1 homology domain-containing protein n=1 Tax=marine sediment metagenome TaxID=412755 RepID=X0W4Q6_9ZZZZ